MTGDSLSSLTKVDDEETKHFESDRHGVHTSAPGRSADRERTVLFRIIFLFFRLAAVDRWGSAPSQLYLSSL